MGSRRAWLAAATALCVAAAGDMALAASVLSPGVPAAAAVVSYSAPVHPTHVAHPFDPPSTPYGPGHLGVDLAVLPGASVAAAADGVVAFAGAVAGRGLVVVTHADGVSTEYEPITPSVRAGDRVRRGEVIGTVLGSHHRCRPGRCLHWGAKRNGDYIEPMSLLHPLGPVRLLPWTT